MNQTVINLLAAIGAVMALAIVVLLWMASMLFTKAFTIERPQPKQDSDPVPDPDHDTHEAFPS